MYALSSPNSSKQCDLRNQKKQQNVQKQNNKFIFSKPNNLLIKAKQPTGKKECADHFDLMVNFGFNYE